MIGVRKVLGGGKEKRLRKNTMVSQRAWNGKRRETTRVKKKSRREKVGGGEARVTP